MTYPGFVELDEERAGLKVIVGAHGAAIRGRHSCERGRDKQRLLQQLSIREGSKVKSLKSRRLAKVCNVYITRELDGVDDDGGGYGRHT